jgi:SNF2 family DNA or RNA helicase
MKNASIKLDKDELTLELQGSEPPSSEDSIFFCNILPAEDKGSGVFLFKRKGLGRQGLADLFAYLKESSFSLKLDSEAKRFWNSIQGDKEELSSSLKAGMILKRKPAKKITIPNFRRKLKPFQIPATAHMLSISHSANFSVPGSGKTTIALAAFAELKSQKTVDVLIVIGPRSSFAPWEGEVKICLPKGTHFLRISGNKDERLRAWTDANTADVVILNYHTASNDIEFLQNLLENREAMLIADESHYIKSISEGKWATTLRAIAPLAKKRVILSGTPTPNSISDLWSQFTFLYPDESLLGSKSEYIYAINKQADPVNDVRTKIFPLFWRIKKKDLQLPIPKVKKISVRFGPIQSAIYNALATKLLHDTTATRIEAAKLKMWRRARLIRMLQAASNPALLAHYSEEFKLPPLKATGLPISDLILRYSDYEVPAKIQSAVSLIHKLLSKDRKIILWTSFVHNIKMLLRLLKDVAPLPLYGGIALSDKEDTEINRERIIHAFRTSKSARLLIANPAACAESISLQKICRDAIYLDRTFNGSHFLQSKDRIHRIGLSETDTVTYYYFIGENSIDEVVDSRLYQKELKMRKLLEQDLTTVNLDSTEDVVSEDSDEDIDFAETLKQIKKHLGYGH